MRVQPCFKKEDVTEDSARTYTFDELKTSAPEGVYLKTGADYGCYFVVVKNRGADVQCVLWSSPGQDLLEPASSNWGSSSFTLTDKKVCFEIR